MPNDDLKTGRARSKEKELRRAYILARLTIAGDDGATVEELMAEIFAFERRHLSDGTVKGEINIIRQKLRVSGSEIREITDGRFVLARPDPTTRALRSAQQAETKRRLGLMLWQIVYGITVPDLSYDLAFLPTKLWARFLAVRQKGVSTVFLDAGSTTLAAMEAFLECEKVPVPIGFEYPAADGKPQKGDGGSDDGSGTWKRTTHLTPRIVTNHAKIVTAILESNHRHTLPSPILVGGEIQSQTESAAGFLADSFLRHNDLRGDVVVVGANAVRQEDQTFSLGSDSVPDRELKRAFLERGTIRVVVFDSTKLAQHIEPFTVFAPLTEDYVDLLITDDGVAAEADGRSKLNVTDFIEAAQKAGIATAVLKTRSSETDEVETALAPAAS